MILILSMMVMAFVLMVFAGFAVQVFATMNGWGFLAFAALLLFLMWRRWYKLGGFERWMKLRTQQEQLRLNLRNRKVRNRP